VASHAVGHDPPVGVEAAVGHALHLCLDTAAALGELNVVVAGRAGHDQVPQARVLGVALLAQRRPALEVDRPQLAAGVVLFVGAALRVDDAACRDGTGAALDAAAADGDVGLAGDVGDQAAAAGVEGVEDRVLDAVGRGERVPVD